MANTVNKWLPLISSIIPAYLALCGGPFIRTGALSAVANTIRLVTLELEGVFSSSWKEREKVIQYLRIRYFQQNIVEETNVYSLCPCKH